MKTVSNFTEGPILGPLLRFAFPILFAMFLQTMYGAVDLIIIGQFCDAAAVSAVSNGSYIMMTLTFVITGISLGVTILLGQKIGEKKLDEGGQIIGNGIVLFFIIAVVVSIFTIFSAGLWCKFLKIPQEAVPPCKSYLIICGAGVIFIVAYNLLGAVFRGLGNSKIPLIIVAIACVFNIFGDLFFVAVLKTGAAGAAIATVLAQALSVVISLLYIRKMELPFNFNRKMIKFNGECNRKVLKLGVPVALQDLLVSISFFFVTAIINSMGLIASAGIGIAEKVCGFIMLVPSSFSQSMSSVVAQNYGAKKMDRAKKALLCGIGSSFIVAIFISYLGFFHGDLLCKLFTQDLQIADAGWQYLKGYSIDVLFTSFLFCLIGFFNGAGRTKFVMIQGIVGAFCVRVPVCYIIHHFFPDSIFYLSLATPCSTFTQILICFVYFKIFNKKVKYNGFQNYNS